MLGHEPVDDEWFRYTISTFAVVPRISVRNLVGVLSCPSRIIRLPFFQCLSRHPTLHAYLFMFPDGEVFCINAAILLLDLDRQYPNTMPSLVKC